MDSTATTKTLKQLRLERGLTQYDIEQATGVAQSRVSLIERGYRRARSDELARIAKLFEIDVAVLLPIDTDPETSKPPEGHSEGFVSATITPQQHDFYDED